MNTDNQFYMAPTKVYGIALSALAVILVGCGGSSGQDPLMLQNSNGSNGLNGQSRDSANSALTPPGKLPSSAIFYAQYVQNSSITGTESFTEYRYIQADKSGDSLYVSLPEGFEGLAGDPSVQNQKVFGARAKSGDPLGIYKSTAISAVGAVQILPPSYNSLLGMQISPNGKTLYFIGEVVNASGNQLFSVAMSGGAVKPIDYAESFSLDASGKKLVYSKVSGGVSQMFVRMVGATGSTRLLTDKFNDTSPQWNHDATRVMFSSRRDEKSYDLFTVKADGTTIQQLTNTPDMDERGASFSPDGSQISYTVQSTDTSKSGLFRAALSDVAATAVQIKASPDLAEETRWSGSGGRSKSAGSPLTPPAKHRILVAKSNDSAKPAKPVVPSPVKL